MCQKSPLNIAMKCGPAVEVLGTVNAAPHPSALTAVRELLQTTDAATSAAGSFVATEQRCSSLTGGHIERETERVGAVYQVAVAVRQGNLLATAFHPELSDDLRWHRLPY